MPTSLGNKESGSVILNVVKNLLVGKPSTWLPLARELGRFQIAEEEKPGVPCKIIL